MKKILTILLVLVLSLTALVGCDFFGTEEPDNGTTLDDAVLWLEELYENDEGAEKHNNYEIVGKIVLNMVDEYTIEWASSDSRITFIADGSGYVTVCLPSVNDTRTTYTLTATVKDSNGNTKEFSMTRVLPVFEQKVETSTVLKEGTAYKMYLNQVTVNKHLFALNTLDSAKNQFINTVEDYTQAADYYAEVSGEGYKFYTTINGTKMYLNATLVPKDDGNVSKVLGFAASTDSVWVYNTETLGWYVTIDNALYVIGTYGSYETVSLSESRHLTADNSGKSQFPASFITADVAANIAPKDEIEITEAPDTSKKYTIGAANSEGTIYFNGTISSGRFNGVTDINSAVAITINEVSGGYTLSFKVNDVVTYIVMNDESTGAATTTNASSASVFEWNGIFSTFEVAEDDNARGFGVSPTSTYLNFSAYALSNGATYNWGQFEVAPEGLSDNIVVEGGSTDTPDDGNDDDNGAGSDNDNTNDPTNGIIFDFGANGDATHYDGAEISGSASYTCGVYTLNLTDLAKVYGNARDAKGNSCIKLGTGSAGASFTFVVPSNVDEIIINAAMYKGYNDNNILVINGKPHTLTKSSNNGEYDAVVIDTTEVKTITVTTDPDLSKPRVMINSIEFSVINGEYVGGEETPDNGETPDEDETTESAYVVSNTALTELKTGDKVVICAPAYTKVLSATKTGFYNIGVDGFDSITDNEVFVVTANADGS